MLMCTQDWSDMDKLLVNSRASRLKSLQALTEMHEYIKFMSDSSKISTPIQSTHPLIHHPLIHSSSHPFTHPPTLGNFESVKPVEQLLLKWQSRCPHPKKDSVNVWDDVVTGRCMMMRKILEHFYSSTPQDQG